MRLPVTVVAGLAGAGKSDLIARWRAAAPAPWALIIDRGDDFKLPRASGPEVADPGAADPSVERVGGCACCTGSVALASALRRLLRRGPWAHLLIELNGAAHPAAFADALRAPALAESVRITERISVVDAGRLEQRLAGSQRAWLAEQVQSADRVLLRVPSSMPAAEGERLATALAALGGAGAFAPRVLIWRTGEAPPPPPAPVSDLLDERERATAQQTLIAVTGERPRWRWVWRVSPDRVFDRMPLVRLFASAGLGDRDALRIEAVFRTERDWLRYREPDWESSHWRRDSRVQVEFDASRIDALRHALSGFAGHLSACIRET